MRSATSTGADPSSTPTWGVREPADHNGSSDPRSLPAHRHHAAGPTARVRQRQRRRRAPGRDRSDCRSQLGPRTGVRQRPVDRGGGGPIPRPVRADRETFLVWNGTGANVMALATMVQPADFVLSTEWAHIHVDETGAPERALGAKIMTLPASADAKLLPDQIDALARFPATCTTPSRASVSITQSTELGTVYFARRGRRALRTAHRLGHGRAHGRSPPRERHGGPRRRRRRAARVHRRRRRRRVERRRHEGRAAVRRGRGLSSTRRCAKRAKYVRKQVNQLPSKMRFVAAQFNALLEDDLWIDLAEPRQRDGHTLYQADVDDPAVALRGAPAVNSRVPAALPPRRSSRCRSGASSGTGTSTVAGALDDRVGHHGRRCRAVRCRRAPSPELIRRSILASAIALHCPTST